MKFISVCFAENTFPRHYSWHNLTPLFSRFHFTPCLICLHFSWVGLSDLKRNLFTFIWIISLRRWWNKRKNERCKRGIQTESTMTFMLNRYTACQRPESLNQFAPWFSIQIKNNRTGIILFFMISVETKSDATQTRQQRDWTLNEEMLEEETSCHQRFSWRLFCGKFLSSQRHTQWKSVGRLPRKREEVRLLCRNSPFKLQDTLLSFTEGLIFMHFLLVSRDSSSLLGFWLSSPMLIPFLTSFIILSEYSGRKQEGSDFFIDFRTSKSSSKSSWQSQPMLSW